MWPHGFLKIAAVLVGLRSCQTLDSSAHQCAILASRVGLSDVKDVLRRTRRDRSTSSAVNTLRIATCVTNGTSFRGWHEQVAPLHKLWRRSARALQGTEELQVFEPVNVCSQKSREGARTKVDAYKSFVSSLPAGDLVLLADGDVMFSWGRANATAVVSLWDQVRSGRPILSMGDASCWIGWECTAETGDTLYPRELRPSGCLKYLNSAGTLGFAGDLSDMLTGIQWLIGEESRAMAEIGCSSPDSNASEAAAAYQRAQAKFYAAHRDMLEIDSSGRIFGVVPEWQLSCTGDHCLRVANASTSDGVTVDGDCSVSIADSSACSAESALAWHAPGEIRKRTIGHFIGQVQSCFLRDPPFVPQRLIYINLDSPFRSSASSPGLTAQERRNIRMQLQLFDYPGRIERLPAVTGAAVTIGSHARLVDKLGIHDNLYTLYRNEPDAINKTVACWFSHVTILERMSAEMSPEQTALILEDDVIFPSGWLGKLQTAFRHAPEQWDLLKICWYGHLRQEDTVNEHWVRVTPPFNDEFGNFFYGGSCGSVVRGSTIQRILQHLQSQPISHYDTNLLGDGKGLRMFVSREKILVVDDALPNTIRKTTSANEEEALTRFTWFAKQGDNLSCTDTVAADESNVTMWQPFLQLFNATRETFMEGPSSYMSASNLAAAMSWTLDHYKLSSELCPAAAALASLLRACKILLSLLPLASTDTPGEILQPHVEESSAVMIDAFKLAERPPWHQSGLGLLWGFYFYYKKLFVSLGIARRASWLETRQWPLDKHVWGWFRTLRPSAVVSLTSSVSALPDQRKKEGTQAREESMRLCWQGVIQSLTEVTEVGGVRSEWWPLRIGSSGISLSATSSHRASGGAADKAGANIDIVIVIPSPSAWLGFCIAVTSSLQKHGWGGCAYALVNQHSNTTCLSPAACTSTLVCTHKAAYPSGDVVLTITWARPVELISTIGVMPQHAVGRVRLLTTVTPGAAITDEVYCWADSCWSTSRLFRPWPGGVLPYDLRWPQQSCQVWQTTVPCARGVAEISDRIGSSRQTRQRSALARKQQAALAHCASRQKGGCLAAPQVQGKAVQLGSRLRSSSLD